MNQFLKNHLHHVQKTNWHLRSLWLTITWQGNFGVNFFTRCGTFHKGNIAHTPVVCSYVLGWTSGSCFMYANLEMCILPPLNSTFKIPNQHPMKQSWLRGIEKKVMVMSAMNHDQDMNANNQEEPRSEWWQWVLGTTTSIPTRRWELVLGTTTSISTRQSELRIDKKVMMMNTKTMTKRRSWPMITMTMSAKKHDQEVIMTKVFDNNDNEC